MRVLISGASGFLGTTLCANFAQRGDDVVKLVRGSGAPQTGQIPWDPASGQLDQSSLEATGPFDVVIHLAGAGVADHRWSVARKQEIADSRSNSTDLLARCLVTLDQPPPLVLSASAIGYYGSRGNELLDETSEPGSGFLAQVCCNWEAATAPLEAVGVTVAHLRTGIVLGREGGTLAKVVPLFRAGIGGRLGPGTQWMSPIAIDDFVKAINFIVEQRLGGPVNLVSPEPVTNAQFTSALAHALHRPAFSAVPRFALAAALGGELVDEVILASLRVTPRALLKAGFIFDAGNIAACVEHGLAK